MLASSHNSRENRPPGKLRRWLKAFWSALRLLRNHARVLDEQRLLAAEVNVARIRAIPTMNSLAELELQVFSQWGDDGIIQWLVSNLPISNHKFVEIGIEDYSESNTRFLLMRNNWSGLVCDSDQANIETIQAAHYYWRHDLLSVFSFVDSSNINGLLEGHGFAGKIGLLHIDIDGMDYWVWQALDVAQPDVVIMEYNSVFGSERALTVPYEPRFSRTEAHFSNLYFGASLVALCDLAEVKGYAFIGCNSAGNNAYFVRREILSEQVPELSPQQGYVESKFRESRTPEGQLSFLSGAARLELIRGLPIYDTRSQKLSKL